MWKLCVVDDESNRTDVDLVREEYSLGRAEESTIRLTERNISRAHARLFHDDDSQWWLEDNGSYTGSFVNGERVTEQVAVQHGDTVQLGDYRLELSDTARQGESESEGQQVATPLVDRFTIVQGPGVGTVHELTDQKLLIGRGEECRIALDDASVSRVHVEVLRTEHGLMILDQGSSNGLRINGAELPSAMLRSGDVVELGDVRLKFLPAGTEDSSPPVVASVENAANLGGGQPDATRRRNLMLSAVAAVLVAILIFSLAGEDEGVPSLATGRMGAEAAGALAPVDTALEALAEAKVLAARGSGVLAHRKLSAIPRNSEIRETEDFLAIERQWADELLKAASESPNREERKALLTLVSQTVTVGADRRARASKALGRLALEEVEIKVVDVSELPTANSGRKATRPTVTRTATKPKPRAPSVQKSSNSGSSARAVSKPKVVKPKASKPRSVSKPKPAKPRPASKVTRPVAQKAPSKPAAPKPVVSKPAPVKPSPAAPSAPELIRDNPF